MKIGKFWKVAGFAGTLAGSAALIAAASGATGAYFDATQTGKVTGNLGSITITATRGGTNTTINFTFKNMLPGVFQTARVTYKNTGANTEDVWLVFTTAKALHAINNLGGFGEAKITSNGHNKFYSINLADGETATLTPITEQGGHCSSTPTGNDVALTPNQSGTYPGCWPVPNKVLLASTVHPTGTGHVTFSFAPGPKWSSKTAEGMTFFCHPLVQTKTGVTGQETQACTATNPQYGLPYEIVATQHGIAPTNTLNTIKTP